VWRHGANPAPSQRIEAPERVSTLGCHRSSSRSSGSYGINLMPWGQGFQDRFQGNRHDGGSAPRRCVVPIDDSGSGREP